MTPGYVGRFAPSPTGPLHAGSLVAALASWLDARAHPGGRWLVRIEDVDRPRCRDGAAEFILGQLAACGLQADETPVWQSSRSRLYDRAAARLIASSWAYPCGCSRADIAAAWRARGEDESRQRGEERVYPGTCADGLHRKAARALRLRLLAPPTAHRASAVTAGPEPLVIDWHDRRLGAQRQNLTKEVGDFVIERADGCWAYQLAVVVDDGDQGVSDVVRGADLADNTPRQIHLQRLLGLPTPRYLHAPLVHGANGEKLSKQNGAAPLDLRDPLAALRDAGAVLGLRVDARDLPSWLAAAVEAWGESLRRLGDLPPAL